MSTKTRITKSLWIDQAPKHERQPKFAGDSKADLVVVGGGYTGLWTALHAAERHPDWRILLLEGATVGHAASGRNGGFVDPVLTHSLSNGIDRWPNEMHDLVRLGNENFAGMRDDIQRYGIDCDWNESGILNFARTEWEAEWLRAGAEEAAEYGQHAEFYDRDRVGEVTKSPAFIAALRVEEQATVDPYRLAQGLLEACLGRGVEVFERSVVKRVKKDGDTVRIQTADGEVHAARVALATNAYPALLPRLSLMTVPVYDYVLATEPLTDAQFESIGWTGREGLADAGNQFHYFRKTADNRIVWGGYDAIYHFGSRRSEALTQREETFTKLERQFFETYPQLAGMEFTHQWGGIIDTSTRFCVKAGLVGGRIAYALGYTGLGVAATRFGADAMLDLLEGEPTERTQSALVRTMMVPFPPEPVRAMGVNFSRWSMAAEDRTGRRNLWLRTMDALGLGFDS